MKEIAVHIYCPYCKTFFDACVPVNPLGGLGIGKIQCKKHRTTNCGEIGCDKEFIVKSNFTWHIEAEASQ